jgi:hypothetical protein
MAINWKQFATAVVYLHIHENKLQDSSSRALAQYTLVQYSSNFHPKRQGQKLRSKVQTPLQTDKRVVASKTRRTPKTPPATAHFFVCHPMAQAHHLDADDSDPAWVQPFEPTSWSTFTNPCLGLFLIDRGTPPQRLRDRLAAAWAHDALTALRLVCQLRGVRGGKGDREGFYTAALWMHENHPRTLAANVSAFAQFGYIKDLPEILHRLVRGADVREVAKDKAVAGLKRPRDPARAEPDAKRSRKQPPGGAGEAEEEVIVPPPPPPNVLHRAHNKDHNYSNLFDAIADFFVLSLKSDLEKLRKGNLSEIGLAAKWCPSVGSSYDQSTELCLAVARRLFPPAAVVVDDAQDGQRRYNYCVLRRLRREVLVPLRTALKIPERYMSARRWSELPYERVPVVAMKGQEGRCSQTRNDAATPSPPARSSIDGHGRSRLCSSEGTSYSEVEQYSQRPQKQQLPVQLFGDLRSVHEQQVGGRARHIVQCVRGARLTYHGAWPRDSLIAFSPDCQIMNLPPEGSSYGEKLDFLLKDLPSSDKFDLGQVFHLILDKAVVRNVQEKDMVRTIFVFTDKKFDQAYEPRTKKPWWRNYREICGKFKDNGYKDSVPQVVLWNLAGPRSAALTTSKDGVMTLSGFSDDLMRLFLEKDGVVEAEDEMYYSIAPEEYKLKVLDEE